MALSRPPDPSGTLDREDHGAHQEGIRRRWHDLAYPLGFRYRIEELGNAPVQQDVFDQLLNHIEGVRGTIADRAQLETLLRQTFTAEQQTARNAVPPGTVASAAEQQGLASAAGFLAVVDTHFRREDIRGFMTEIPSTLRPLTADGRWVQTGLTLALSGGTVTEIRINLNDSAWRSGDEAAIRQKLLNKLPSDVGIEMEPTTYNHPLTDADITSILGTSCNVISQRVPLWDLELADVPAADQRTLVDTAGILRDDPTVASFVLGVLQAECHVAGLRRGLFNRHVRCFDAAGAAVDVTAFTDWQVDRVVAALFNRLNRTGKELARDSSTLSAAITRRAAVDRLISSDAKNRELLAALATIRRDPSAIDAILGGRDVENLNRRRRVAEILEDMRGYSAIVPPTPLPPDSTLHNVRTVSADVAGDIVTLQAQETTWLTNDTAYQANMRTYQVDLSTYEREKNDRDAIIARNDVEDRRWHAEHSAWVAGGSHGLAPPHPTHPPLPPAPTRPVQPAAPTFIAFTLHTPFAGGPIRSIDELRTKLSDYRRIQGELSQVDARLEERGRLLVQLYTALNIPGLNIAATFPTFFAFIDPTGPTFRDNILHANENWNAIIQEVRRNIPEGLKSIDEYTQKLEELRTQGGVEKLDGSKACWDVIRRGLENQRHPPLSQEEIEATLKALRAQTQLSPELRRDIELFQQRDVPEGEGRLRRRWYNRRPWGGADREHFWQFWRSGQERWLDDPAAEDWNNERAFRRLWTLGAKKKQNSLEQYTRNLFQPGRIGLGLNDDPRERRFRLPTLIDAYRRTKYLLEKIGDPYRLSNSERYQRFVRELHGAILERAFLSFEHASETNPADKVALEEAGVTDTMNAERRLQAVRSFLLDGGDEYYKSQGSIIEGMAKSAYRPIERAKAAHEKWVVRWKKVGSGALAAGAFGGKAVKVLTWPVWRPAKLVAWDIPKAGVTLVKNNPGKTASLVGITGGLALGASVAFFPAALIAAAAVGTYSIFSPKRAAAGHA